MSASPISLSTVTPVYHGEDYLEELVGALHALKTRWETRDEPLVLLESIFVVDDALDGSEAVLAELRKKHDWVRVITLSRNFGQHAATMAGVLHTSGDWVATLDEDLQHHPEQLEKLLVTALESGSDVVYARAAIPIHESVFRDNSSSLYKRILAVVSGNRSIVSYNSFRMVRGVILRAAASVASYDTYLDIAISWFSCRLVCVEIPMKDQRYIQTARSGYTAAKLFRHARRLLVSSDPKVIRAGGIFGVGVLAATMTMSIAYAALRIVRPDVIWLPGWTSLIVTNLFLGGIICLMLAVALEYLGIILLKIQGKPSFFAIDRSKDAVWTEWKKKSAERTHVHEDHPVVGKP